MLGICVQNKVQRRDYLGLYYLPIPLVETSPEHIWPRGLLAWHLGQHLLGFLLRNAPPSNFETSSRTSPMQSKSIFLEGEVGKPMMLRK